MVHCTQKQGLGTEPPASANIVTKSLEASLLVTSQGGMESVGTAIIFATSGWIYGQKLCTRDKELKFSLWITS